MTKRFRHTITDEDGCVVEVSAPVAHCPHPARHGRHEIYARKNGTCVCRACGEELGDTFKPKKKTPNPEPKEPKP